MDMSLAKSKYIVFCANDVFGLNCGQYECGNHGMNDLNVLKIPYTTDRSTLETSIEARISLECKI